MQDNKRSEESYNEENRSNPNQQREQKGSAFNEQDISDQSSQRGRSQQTNENLGESLKEGLEEGRNRTSSPRDNNKGNI